MRPTIFGAPRVVATMSITIVMTIVIVTLPAGLAAAQRVTKETIPGITNFARLETTIACGGATKPEAMVELKRMGYASVIALRETSEAGADIDAEASAARAAGMTFVHLPFKIATPDPLLIDHF